MNKKDKPELARKKAFLKEYEALCKKHGCSFHNDYVHFTKYPQYVTRPKATKVKP